jgi:hypothetical protein
LTTVAAEEFFGFAVVSSDQSLSFSLFAGEIKWTFNAHASFSLTSARFMRFKLSPFIRFISCFGFGDSTLLGIRIGLVEAV